MASEAFAGVPVGGARVSVVVPGTPLYGARLNVATPDGAHVLVTSAGIIGPGGSPVDVIADRFLPVVPGRAAGYARSITPDGAVTVVETTTALTADDTNDDSDLYLASAGGVERIALGSALTKHELKALADDGSAVVLQTTQTLAPGDMDAKPDLYRWTSGSGTVELLTPGTTGALDFVAASRDTSRVVFSSDEGLVGNPVSDGIYERATGDYVLRGAGIFRGLSDDGGRLFSTTDLPLVPADTVDEVDAFLSTDQGITLLTPGVDYSAQVTAITSDGERWLLLTRDRLTPDDTDDTTDVYLCGGDNPVLVTSGAEEGTSGLMSRDARFVVYGTASAIVPADTDTILDYYRWDALDPTHPVLLTSGGGPPGEVLSITDDGSGVAMYGRGRALPADTDAADDVYLWQNGTMYLLSPSSPGTVDLVFVSVDGQRIFFETAAKIDPEDVNTSFDVYVADLDLQAPVPTLSSIPAQTTSRSATFQTGTAAGDHVWLDAKVDGGDWFKAGSRIELTNLALGSHTVQLHAYDAAGNRSPTPAMRTWTITDGQPPPPPPPDTTPPTARSPTHRLVNGSAISSGRTAVRLAWSGSDAASGIARYELMQSTDGGLWTTVSTTLTTATVDRLLAPGHTYRFRLVAIDGAGNPSAPVYGPTFRLTHYGETNSRISYTGSWSSSSSPAYWGSKAKAASRTGARATIRVAGRSIEWVARRGPTRGKAQVYVNGVLKATVDLYSPTYQNQRVVWAANWSTSATRTISIRVLGTSGRPRVDLDAFVVGS